MWGENGRVLLWDISHCRRISDVQLSAEPHPRPTQPAYEDYTFRVPLPNSGEQICWDHTGWGIESIGLRNLQGEHHALRGITDMRPAFEDRGPWILGWGGSSGAPGTGSGGFVGVWQSQSGNLEYPLCLHPHAISYAQVHNGIDQLLTSTYVAEPGNSSPASVHLWHLPTNTELIPSIPVFNNAGAYSQIDPAGQMLTIRTQSGADSREENFRYITYKLDLTSDPEINPDDPRLDIVIRTGTYLDKYGSVAFLSREAWKSVCDNPTRPAYDSWFFEINNPRMSRRAPPPKVSPKEKEMLRRRREAASPEELRDGS